MVGIFGAQSQATFVRGRFAILTRRRAAVVSMIDAGRQHLYPYNLFLTAFRRLSRH